MIAKKMFLTMFEYDHLTNNRLLNLAAKLTAEEWDAPGDSGQYSLHEALFHLLVVADEWREFCQEMRPNFEYYKLDAFPNVASLRAFSDRVYDSARVYLESIDEAGLAATVFGRLPDDADHTVVIWRVLTYALYHSAQHRSDAAALLTKYGQSPGSIDFFGFMWER